MYILNYDLNGKPSTITKIIKEGEGVSFAINDNLSEFQEFLKWNKAQKTPLDLNSTIEVIKPVDPMIALKADYKSATTATQKIAIIAKALNLE